MNLSDIPNEELCRYQQELIPVLLRYKPYQWVKISSIANDTSRFIEIVTLLHHLKIFDNYMGWSLISIKENSLIRIDPMTILKPHKIAYQWNNKLSIL